MLNLNYWKKACQPKASRVISYEDALYIVTNAQRVSIYSVEGMIKEFKELQEEDPESDYSDIIYRFEKLPLNNKIIEIDSGDGYPLYFYTTNTMDCDNDYLKLLNSEAFWNAYYLHNIIINDKSLGSLNKEFSRIYF